MDDFEDVTENEEDVGSSSAAMMSLFASYYGIEDVSATKGKTAAELIDTAHFDPDEYVRDLLETKQMESLVKQDTIMVHEIRTLDSDMQVVFHFYSFPS
jgi:GTP-sensing pleiotropic transcriptional regulator CodY